MAIDYSAPALEREAKIMALQQELTPVFSDSHYVLGHGTVEQENAERILDSGLYSVQGPAVQTLALDLENSREGMEKIFDWPHEHRKYIVVLSVPKTAKKNQQGDSLLTNIYGKLFMRMIRAPLFKAINSPEIYTRIY